MSANCNGLSARLNGTGKWSLYGRKRVPGYDRTSRYIAERRSDLAHRRQLPPTDAGAFTASIQVILDHMKAHEDEPVDVYLKDPMDEVIARWRRRSKVQRPRRVRHVPSGIAAIRHRYRLYG